MYSGWTNWSNDPVADAERYYDWCDEQEPEMEHCSMCGEEMKDGLYCEHCIEDMEEEINDLLDHFAKMHNKTRGDALQLMYDVLERM